MAWIGWGHGRSWKGKGVWPRWEPIPPTRMMEITGEEFPLNMAKPGEKVVVKAIFAGWGAYYRAQSMGIAPGTKLEVVENNLQYPWSPVIVRVRGVEVALGRGLASKILVLRYEGDKKEEG